MPPAQLTGVAWRSPTIGRQSFREYPGMTVFRPSSNSTRNSPRGRVTTLTHNFLPASVRRWVVAVPTYGPPIAGASAHNRPTFHVARHSAL